MPSLKRNIPLMYIILGLENALFWSAIWILYYLRFTNYAGIGIIESVMIITAFITEVPTGAIADLLGKKKTLILAMILGAIGNIIMGMADSYSYLVISVFILTIAATFISGTAQALIYDTLLTLKKEETYERILGNHSTIKMLTIAAASIIGGFLYTLDTSFPFFAIAFCQLIAMVLCFFLIEPPIDSEQFNLRNYFNQTKQGFLELFRKNVVLSSIIVIALTAITSINGHFLIDAQLVTQGWSAKTLGIITALMFLFSAVLAQFTAIVSTKFGKHMGNILAAASIAITMIIIPWLGVFVATAVIMTRNGLLEIFGNTANAIINQNVRSHYRATALSAYTMLASIPYVFGAYAIGYLIDNNSVNVVGIWLGIALLVVSIGGIITSSKQN